METKVKIWNETTLYMRTEWTKYRNRILQSTIIVDQAEYLLGFKFGQNEKVFTLTDQILTFAHMPPGLDKACN